MVKIDAHCCLYISLSEVRNVSELIDHVPFLLYATIHLRLPTRRFLPRHLEMLIEEFFELWLLSGCAHVDLRVGELFLLLARLGTRSLSRRNPNGIAHAHGLGNIQRRSSA